VRWKKKLHNNVKNKINFIKSELYTIIY
jgi:hypothetical protein